MTRPPNEAPWAADPPGEGTDPERLAALLDGRLSDAERDALLARLAEDDDDLALFAEAAAIQRALEAEDAAEADADARIPLATTAAEPAPEPGVIPLRRPAQPARGVARPLLRFAAVVAGLSLLTLAWRAARPGAVTLPGQAVAMLESPDAGLPPAWLENAGWAVTRGGDPGYVGPGTPTGASGGVDGVEDRAARMMAARAGAHTVDLELAIRARNAEQTRTAARRLAALVGTVPAGSVFAAAYTQIGARAGADPAELLASLDEASRSTAEAMDAEWFALGGWAQAARLAAVRRDAEFFRGARTRRTLQRAEALVRGDADAQRALAGINAARAADTLDWSILGTEANRLLYAIAS